MHSAVRLQPEPRSAGMARAWIREQLTRMGRPELVDAAQLATSELVTNAVLHARTRITVAVRNDGDQIMIEVGDGSGGRVRPELTGTAPGGLATVGNGLHIIGALARRWGVRERNGEGKTVWFVPASPEEHSLAAPRFPPDLLAGIVPDDADAVVAVLNAPVRLLWEARFRVRDLRREMSLLTMQSPAATRSSRRMLWVAQEIERTKAAVRLSHDDFEQAVLEEAATVSLDYVVSSRAGVACAQLADLLDEADGFCRDGQMLTLPAPPEELRMRRWFLSEFIRQTKGEAPVPWESPGPDTPAR